MFRQNDGFLTGFSSNVLPSKPRAYGRISVEFFSSIAIVPRSTLIVVCSGRDDLVAVLASELTKTRSNKPRCTLRFTFVYIHVYRIYAYMLRIKH